MVYVLLYYIQLLSMDKKHIDYKNNFIYLPFDSDPYIFGTCEEPIE